MRMRLDRLDGLRLRERNAHRAPFAHPDGGLSRQNEAQQLTIQGVERGASDAVGPRHRHKMHGAERHTRHRHHSAIGGTMPFSADHRIHGIQAVGSYGKSRNEH